MLVKGASIMIWLLLKPNEASFQQEKTSCLKNRGGFFLRKRTLPQLSQHCLLFCCGIDENKMLSVYPSL